MNSEEERKGKDLMQGIPCRFVLRDSEVRIEIGESFTLPAALQRHEEESFNALVNQSDYFSVLGVLYRVAACSYSEGERNEIPQRTTLKVISDPILKEVCHILRDIAYVDRITPDMRLKAANAVKSLGGKL